MREEGRGVWFFAPTPRECLKSAGFPLLQTPHPLLFAVAPSSPRSTGLIEWVPYYEGWLFANRQEPPRRRRRWLMMHVVMAMKMRVMAPRCAVRWLLALVLSNAMTATPQTHKHIRRMPLLCCLCTCAGSGSRIAHSPARRTHVRRRRRHVLAEPMSDEGHRATFAELMSKDGLRPLGE